MSVNPETKLPGGGPTNSPIPIPETKLPEILPIQLQCQHCGIKWQFQNADNVAEKSINHHYKSGECIKRQEDIIKFNHWQQRMYQEYYKARPVWQNPRRGYWSYV